MLGNDPNMDDQLLDQIAKGDEHAFGQFYHQTGSQLYHAIMIFVKDEMVAREIMQVCYIRIWDRRRELHQVHSPVSYTHLTLPTILRV